MGFRRDGKREHAHSRAWRAWLESNGALLRAAGLPPSVLRSRSDWEYLLRYGYHCDGPYPDIDFRLEELSGTQREAFRALLAATLPEGKRECAAWHFVSPPGVRDGRRYRACTLKRVRGRALTASPGSTAPHSVTPALGFDEMGLSM